jgi:hypothetical protein
LFYQCSEVDVADEHVQQPSTQNEKTKKPFEPPRLQVYGDIAALTRKVGRTGISDGGVGSNKATRP